jgi:hypothetical protein
VSCVHLSTFSKRGEYVSMETYGLISYVMIRMYLQHSKDTCTGAKQWASSRTVNRRKTATEL